MPSGNMLVDRFESEGGLPDEVNNGSCENHCHGTYGTHICKFCLNEIDEKECEENKGSCKECSEFN